MTKISHPTDIAVSFSKVTVTLGENTILKDVTAQVPRGSCTAIVGPNGAGKTTLIMSLLGEVPYIGDIQFIGKDKKEPLKIGYVPQKLQFDRGMRLTVLEFLVMGWQRGPIWFGVRKKYRDRALKLLSSVGMEGIEKRRLGALSGGEIQRVLLALALGEEPNLLVLDEPSSGVDFQGEHLFCKLLETLRSEKGFTQLIVSHDLPTVAAHATNVICLNKTVFAEGPPREVLTTNILSRTFGLHMGILDEVLQKEGRSSVPACIKEDSHA